MESQNIFRIFKYKKRDMRGLLRLIGNIIVLAFFIGIFTWYIKGHSPKNSKYYYVFWGCTIYIIIMHMYHISHPIVYSPPYPSLTGAEAWEQNMR